MNDTREGADLEPVVEEQAEVSEFEDQELEGFDNLDDAADALADDLPDDEEPQDEDEAPDDEPEAEAEDEESDEGDAIVALPDGTELSLSEIADLQANGLRAADYTHKTTELAAMRKEVESTKKTYSERVQHAETALQNITGFLEGLIPPEPTIELAQTNPAAYTQQKAVRETAIAEMRKLIDVKNNLDAHRQQVSESDMQSFRQRETDALVKAMPHLADPVKRAAFDKKVHSAAEAFGFTPEEIAATADHRILQMVHYAHMGRISEQNRNNAKRRVQTPVKGRAKPAQVPAAQRQNTDAMKRLSKSGSIADAMNIDFD